MDRNIVFVNRIIVKILWKRLWMHPAVFILSILYWDIWHWNVIYFHRNPQPWKMSISHAWSTIIINAFEHVCQYLFANKTRYLIQAKVESSFSTYSWMQKFAHLWNKRKKLKEFNIYQCWVSQMFCDCPR